MHHDTLASAVIFTALPLEFRAVRRHLLHLSEEVHPSGTIYKVGTLTTPTEPWRVCIAQTGAGNASAAQEVERAINHFNPQVVLFVGVAGGCKDVRLGDVVAATKIYGYESAKVGKTLLVRPELGNASYALVQRARAEIVDEEWQSRIKQPQNDHSPRAFVGPIASGEKVIATTSAELSTFLQQTYNDTLAIEMEGYGFLKAAYANQHVQALVVRGISDLLDNKSTSDAANWQEIAADHASAFACEILAKYRPTPATDETHRRRSHADQSPSSQADNGQYITKFFGPAQDIHIGDRFGSSKDKNN